MILGTSAAQQLPRVRTTESPLRFWRRHADFIHLCDQFVDRYNAN
jgi:hypothetical protein